MTKLKMNKFDIEFYNGLMKGIVSCHDIVKKSSSREEALRSLNSLMEKIQDKISEMVEEALD
jgi:hypothetical protein